MRPRLGILGNVHVEDPYLAINDLTVGLTNVPSATTKGLDLTAQQGESSLDSLQDFIIMTSCRFSAMPRMACGFSDMHTSSHLTRVRSTLISLLIHFDPP